MQDWQKLLSKLTKSDLEFFLVGGAALVLHGLPRTTLDADIYIPANSKNFELLFKIVCDELSLKSEQTSLREHKNKANLFIGQWFSFSNGEIDLLDVYLEDENEFKSLFQKCETVKFNNENIKILSMREIKKMKEKIARPLDLADIALIDEFIE